MSQGKIRRATFWVMMFIAVVFIIGGAFYIYVDHRIKVEITALVGGLR